MPLEILTAQIMVNKSHTFTFQKKIMQHMVGIQELYLIPTGAAVCITTLSLILHEQLAGEVLGVTALVDFEDSAGNYYEASDSYVNVVVIAWTDKVTSNLLMTNSELTNIEDNSESPAIVIPTKMPDGSSPPNPLLAALAGFNLRAGTHKYVCLGTMSAGVGTTSNMASSTATVKGSASMHNDSGHQVATATVNGALLSDCDPDLTLRIIPISNLQTDLNQSGSVTGSYNNAIALLSGFVITQNTPAGISGLRIAIQASMQTENKYIVCGYAGLAHGKQDDSQSHVNGFIVCY